MNGLICAAYLWQKAGIKLPVLERRDTIMRCRLLPETNVLKAMKNP